MGRMEPSLRHRSVVPVLVLLAGMALTACAAPAASGPPSRLPLILVTRSPWDDRAALADALTRSCQLRSFEIRALSPRSFALSLICAEATICRQARERLVADCPLVAAVEDDVRQRIPTLPAPAATR